MAISTQRKLSELQKECEKLGLKVTQSGSRVSKTDYVLALRDYYLQENYPNGVPEYLQLQLDLLEEGPQLAAQSKKAGQELPIMKEMLESKYTIAEEKLDGNRLICHFNESFHCYSRNISVKDFLPVDYSENIIHNIDFNKVTNRFILDGEITATDSTLSTVLAGKGVICETQLQATSALLAMEPSKSREIQIREGVGLRYNAFDCLWWNGESLMDKPYLERRKYLLQAIKELQEAGMDIKLPRSVVGDAKKLTLFYNSIIAEGGEGIIVKDVRAKYTPGKRDPKIWMKIKRTIGESASGDTWDGFVTGYKIGTDPDKWNYQKVSALEFSTYLEDGSTHVIANISNIDHETLEKWTTSDVDGNPCLDPSVYGKVAELTGQCFSAKAKALKHAALVRWLPLKTSEECTVSMKTIEENIL